jgi:glycerol uptake facilitator-like aquaporin
MNPVPSELLPPDLQADVGLRTVMLFALLNPAAIAVAFWMGRKADQTAKLIIAAFAGAAAGTALLWLAAFLRLSFAATPGRAAAGIFAVQCIACLAWAWAGYRTAHPRSPSA